MKKRILSVFLLSALLLASCGSADTPADTTTPAADTTTAETEPELTPELPAKNYNGDEFVVYGRSGTQNMFFPEEMTGEKMNDASYERAQRISEKYNITFRTAISGDANGMDAMNSILAGDDAYDVIIPRGRSAFSYASAGLVLDWNTDLPYVDLDQPWWNADARESFSIGNKLYVMIGDITSASIGSANCMMFNKVILDTYDIEYPYQMVVDGTWTFEAFNKLARQTNKDLNGDTVMSLDDDQYGYVTTQWGGPAQVLYSGGQRILGKDEDNLLTLTLNTPGTIATFEKYFNFLQEECCYLETTGKHDGVKAAFREGRVVFFDSILSTTATYRDMEDDFGILPFPKMDEDMERYYSNVDAGTGLYVVPVTASDPEQVSIILEELAWDGWKNIVPVYYDEVLAIKVSRDEESKAMLEYVREGRVFDIGYYYDGFTSKFIDIGRNLAISADHNFTTLYAQYESAALAKIEEINAYYTE